MDLHWPNGRLPTIKVGAGLLKNLFFLSQTTKYTIPSHNSLLAQLDNILQLQLVCESIVFHPTTASLLSSTTSLQLQLICEYSLLTNTLKHYFNQFAQRIYLLTASTSRRSHQYGYGDSKSSLKAQQEGPYDYVGTRQNANTSTSRRQQEQDHEDIQPC